MSDYRAPLLYDARKIAAARELGAAHGATASSSVRNLSGTLPCAAPGLGCDCRVSYTGGGLKGYRTAWLDGVHKTQLHGLAQSPAAGTPALIPVSDRTAVNAAVRLFKGLRP